MHSVQWTVKIFSFLKILQIILSQEVELRSALEAALAGACLLLPEPRRDVYIDVHVELVLLLCLGVLVHSSVDVSELGLLLRRGLRLLGYLSWSRVLALRLRLLRLLGRNLRLVLRNLLHLRLCFRFILLD